MLSATLHIGRADRASPGIAALTLRGDNNDRICRLDLEYQRLAVLRNRNPVALELLLLAGSVYALDRAYARQTAGDSWTRSFSLTLPVADPKLWAQSRPAFVDCLEFLTGDRWVINFVARKAPILTLRAMPVSSRPFFLREVGQTCLFSGGLDSLVGAINLLEASDARVLLVGHHDRDMAGPYGDQQALLQRLRNHYPRRIGDVLARVGQSGAGHDVTLRARSFLFIALGVFAASAIGMTIPLFVPENGTIALNVPLTPSRRGSCSTRTAHPRYLSSLGQALDAIGLGTSVVNPFVLKTKGEVVAGCRNPGLLRLLVPLSVSCAKRGHRREWLRRTAHGCGRCMPCIFRRAALHKVGLDQEVYGVDVCGGEVDVGASDVGGGDFRACLSLLRRGLSRDQLATALLVNGPLEIQQLPAYADTVARALQELRQLFRDKGTPAVRRAAGLSV